MPRLFSIAIDLDRLRENLSKEEGRPMTAAEVLDWLRDAGFVQVPGGSWNVRECDLGHLTPDEVLAADVVGEADESSGAPPHPFSESGGAPPSA